MMYFSSILFTFSNNEHTRNLDLLSQLIITPSMLVDSSIINKLVQFVLNQPKTDVVSCLLREKLRDARNDGKVGKAYPASLPLSIPCVLINLCRREEATGNKEKNVVEVYIYNMLFCFCNERSR